MIWQIYVLVFVSALAVTAAVERGTIDALVGSFVAAVLWSPVAYWSSNIEWGGGFCCQPESINSPALVYITGFLAVIAFVVFIRSAIGEFTQQGAR